MPSRGQVLEAIEGPHFMVSEMGATGAFNSVGLIKDCMGAHWQLEDQLEGYCKDLARDQLCPWVKDIIVEVVGRVWIYFENRAK